MSATGTDDRFLRAAFVEGTAAVCPNAPFSVMHKTIRAPSRWTKRYCAEMESHLRPDFAARFTVGDRSWRWHLRSGSDSTPIAYGPA